MSSNDSNNSFWSWSGLQGAVIWVATAAVFVVIKIRDKYKKGVKSEADEISVEQAKKNAKALELNLTEQALASTQSRLITSMRDELDQLRSQLAAAMAKAAVNKSQYDEEHDAKKELQQRVEELVSENSRLSEKLNNTSRRLSGALQKLETHKISPEETP